MIEYWMESENGVFMIPGWMFRVYIISKGHNFGSLLSLLWFL